MLAEALPRQDAFIENKDNQVYVDALWLANFVDIYNSSMQLIEDELLDLSERITALGG